LRPALGRVIGSRRLHVVDSADTTAARVRRIIAVNHLEAEAGSADVDGPGLDRDLELQHEVMVTADPARFTASASRLFAAPLPEPRLVRPFPPVIRVAAGS
jgi:hypothetical protein